MTRPLVICGYDPAWPGLFERERTALLQALPGNVRAIEHIGSTTVPGLAAKPVIDILVGLYQWEDSTQCIQPVISLGYHYRPDFESIPGFEERRFFQKDSLRGVRTHHIHMVAFD